MKLSQLEKSNARVLEDTKCGICDRFAMQEEDPINLPVFLIGFSIILNIDHLIQNPKYIETSINYIKSLF